MISENIMFVNNESARETDGPRCDSRPESLLFQSLANHRPETSPLKERVVNGLMGVFERDPRLAAALATFVRRVWPEFVEA
jgi:hypothetical protein